MRGEGKEKDRERNIDWLPLLCPPTRDQTRNPSMCPDWELNLLPFALRDDAQITEPQQSGPEKYFIMEQMWQVKHLYPLYLREENKELKLNDQISGMET